MAGEPILGLVIVITQNDSVFYFLQHSSSDIFGCPEFLVF